MNLHNIYVMLNLILLLHTLKQLHPGQAKTRGWVGRGSCLFEDKRKDNILAPSVLSQNLQLPAHELISPNTFYETLNKGKLSPINYEHFSLWSGKQLR